MVVALCAAGVLLISAAQNFSLIKFASFIMFGSTDPYLSPAREQEIRQEIGEMIQKEFGAGKR